MDRGTVGYNPWDLKELDMTEYACKYPGQTLRACGQRKVHPGLRESLGLLPVGCTWSRRTMQWGHSDQVEKAW